METTTRTMLDEEIAKEFEDLYSMESGSKERSAAVDDLVKLYKLKIEEDKIEYDAEDKFSSQKRNKEAEDIRIQEQKKDRWIKVCVTGAELMIPLVFYGIWMQQGFKFEETGAYSSTTFRGLINRFRPTKK